MSVVRFSLVVFPYNAIVKWRAHSQNSHSLAARFSKLGSRQTLGESKTQIQSAFHPDVNAARFMLASLAGIGT